MRNHKRMQWTRGVALVAVALSTQSVACVGSASRAGVKPNQVFAVHPDNPRCFLYQGKPFKILTSAEHYGAVMNTEFDYDIYLKEMRRTGQNQTRVFTFYRELWGYDIRNTLAADPKKPQTTIVPWKRAKGRGTGPDGLDKFDLNQWNPAYFARLRDYVRKCAEHGVICEIVLFCNPYNDRQYNWYPCSKVSNVNDVGHDLDERRQFITLDAPSVVAFQERLVRKVVEEVNEFDSVYYEICNEPYGRTFPEEWKKKGEVWHAHLARFIRQVEKDLPKQHLIAVNVPDSETLVQNPDVDILNHHYPPGARTWRFMRDRDHYGKPLVFDENFTGIVGSNSERKRERYPVNRAEAWLTILSGCAGFSSLDWTFTAADETGSGKVPLLDGRTIDGRPLREWLGVFRKLLSEYNLTTLVPAESVLPEKIPGYGCAASTDGKGRYIVYFVDGRLLQGKTCAKKPLKVPLNLPSARYSVRTFDPKTGATVKLPTFRSTGSVRLKIPEFTKDIAVLLEHTE